MAWTTPRRWVGGDMATAAILNTHIRDNLLVLSTHAHAGGAGDGNDELSGLDFLQLDSIGAASVAGQLKRNINHITWGAGGYVISNVDDVAGTACLRTVGTGAQQVAAGNHAHV